MMLQVYDARNSGLHDYNFKGADINYISCIITISLESPRGENDQLIIKNFLVVQITHKEEWGKGSYICSSNVQSTLPDEKMLEIELNSGDNIKVIWRE